MAYTKGARSRIVPIPIDQELKASFLDYAMSVVVSRAIPDIRDGLKPVHRRILYTMHKLGFYHNKPYHKSVRIVGEVLGKFHPHGEQALYGSMVGMVQEFSKRYPLLDGQGNWGSVDGDNAAAMRYTEVRMAKIAQELLQDLEKETVNFVPNFDESTVEPTMLPSKLPHLLINGTSGIAVGMATAIPPHNFSEIIAGCLALLDDENLPNADLFSIVTGPDFPTGGIICGRAGIEKAYATGRGSVTVRGVVDIEETKKGARILITELPYQVNKSELIIKIADLVKNKVIEGITNIRDESDKSGIRVVIDIKRGEIPDVVLNLLYKHTSLQTSVTVLMLGLLDRQPLVFTLRQLILEFLRHRQVIIIRRTQFDLKKAVAREHILMGLIIALDHIEEIVKIVKASADAKDATEKLIVRFELSTLQCQALLEMKLQRLTGLERQKIMTELTQVRERIAYLRALLQDEELIKQEIRKELFEVDQIYGDERRTRIEGPIDALEELDLIAPESMVVTLTRKGYIKRVPLSIYDIQHRGGKGKMGMTALDEFDDVLQDIFISSTHDMLLFFTSLGRVYSLLVYQIPEASRTAKGRAIVNLLPLAPNERVVKLLNLGAVEEKFVVMVTKKGLIKRTAASAFAKIRSTGIRALTLGEDDELAFCSVSSGGDTILLATASGSGIRFPENEVRGMGRQAAGVIGIRLRELSDGPDYVVGMEVISEDKDILFVTERGYGKRVRAEDFRIAHRGGYGVRTIPTDKRNGPVIGLAVVDDKTDVLLIDNRGKIIRLSPHEVRTMGRQAKGIRLIRLTPEHSLAGLAVREAESDEDEEETKDA